MKRKTFIQNISTLATLYPLLNSIESCSSPIGKRKGKKIFVFIQLTGGNDGLHTLLPMNNYGLLKEARKHIFIPEHKLLPLRGSSDVALHPSLAGIRDMFDNGKAGFVQGVGYDHTNFSHFRSSDIWLTGSDSSSVLYSGWVARYLETRFNNYPNGYPNQNYPHPPAIKIGDTGTFMFQGSAMDMSIVVNPKIAFDSSGTTTKAEDLKSFGDVEVKTIREMLLQADRYAGVVQQALKVPFASSKRYPKKGDNPLADQLKVVSNLINAGLDTSVYLVNLNGFDTHVEQSDTSDSTKGNHANLLHKLSEAITCFWEDVVHMGREDDVAGMTFSEFGRRIVETSGFGTDHGTAQPILFFGNSIETQLIGTNPELPQKATAEDNLAIQHNFKSVYSSILQQWFETDKQVVNTIIPGSFPTLNMFHA